MELRDYLTVLIRRRILVIAAVAVVAAVAGGVSLTAPASFSATATVSTPSVRMESYLANMPAEVLFERELNIARSGEVLAEAASAAGVTDPDSLGGRVSVSSAGVTSKATLQFTATGSDVEGAVAAANALADAYVRVTNSALLSDAEAYSQAVAEAAAASDSGTAERPSERPMSLESARAEGVTALVGARAQLLRPAATASETRPDPIRSALLGATIGLFLGIALALVADQMAGSRQSAAASERV